MKFCAQGITGMQRQDSSEMQGLTTADAFCNALVHIILRQQLLAVIIDGQDGTTLADVVVQLLYFGLHLQTELSCTVNASCI